ncbi:LysE family translocator [Paenibacillus typhae]|uniref:LysE family translocator n=1 Tax=Paenibacillus typhae TaxID=1174501 RepID=UPI001C8E59E7|nr:LysE family transporter [Paenibacillus typhae]MBY0008947.1 LysE family transporter [Paenibacillus typhae]
MTLWPALLGGVGFGFIVAAPVGPMSLLCMNRTLRQGLSAGLATGAGIALADAFYALVTVAGFKAVGDFTAAYALLLKLLGSLFIAYLGLKAWRTAGAAAMPETARSGMLFSLLTSFLLTLANPATVLSFMALSASLGSRTGSSLFLPAGIALGSFCWWLLLALIIKGISRRLPDSFTRILSRISAAVLILFSIYGIFNALQ